MQLLHLFLFVTLLGLSFQGIEASSDLLSSGSGSIPFADIVPQRVAHSLHRRSNTVAVVADWSPDVYRPTHARGLERRGLIDATKNFFSTVETGAKITATNAVAWIKKHRGALIGVIVTVVATILLSAVFLPLIGFGAVAASLFGAFLGGGIGMDVQQAIEKNQTSSISAYFDGFSSRMKMDLISAVMALGLTAAFPLIGKGLSMAKVPISQGYTMAKTAVTQSVGKGAITSGETITASAARSSFLATSASADATVEVSNVAIQKATAYAAGNSAREAATEGFASKITSLQQKIAQSQVKLAENPGASTIAERVQIVKYRKAIDSLLPKLKGAAGIPLYTKTEMAKEMITQSAFGLVIVGAITMFLGRKRTGAGGLSAWDITRSCVIHAPPSTAAPTGSWYLVPSTGLGMNSTVAQAKNFTQAYTRGTIPLPRETVQLDTFPTNPTAAPTGGMNPWTLDQDSGSWETPMAGVKPLNFTITKNVENRMTMVMDDLGNQMLFTEAVPGQGISLFMTSIIMDAGFLVTHEVASGVTTTTKLSLDGSSYQVENFTDANGNPLPGVPLPKELGGTAELKPINPPAAAGAATGGAAAPTGATATGASTAPTSAATAGGPSTAA